ncbi:uncharacterized protein LOC143447357 [Clavelina lepadiformis]|uniref:Uncharacterized protein n=1 Tax=Clavelina lepadiformis TaxID=159417 RepID=A0ABP0GWB6_CLALP
MKLLHLWSIAMVAMFFRATEGKPVPKDTRGVLQRLLADAFGDAGSGGIDLIYNEPEPKADSVLIPRLMSALSNEYENFQVNDSHKRQHSRRNAPDRRHIRRRPGGRYRCQKNKEGKCKIVKCNFGTAIDRLSYNPRFGCPILQRLGEQRKW